MLFSEDNHNVAQVLLTKVHAAEICLKDDIDMIITNGENTEILYDILDNKSIGTLFSKGEQS